MNKTNVRTTMSGNSGIVCSALLVVLAAFSVVSTAFAAIKDSIGPNQVISFYWTINGNMAYNGVIGYQTLNSDGTWSTPTTTQPNPNGDGSPWHFSTTGQSPGVTFAFSVPKGLATPTDFRQTITSRNGTGISDTGVVNLTDPPGDPWTFQPLTQLLNENGAIPDLAPMSGGGTIYSFVNLSIYLQDNPLGFNGGNYAVGQKLDDLGLSIVNGQMAGVEGIWWSTTPFTFDLNSANGFDTDGLLDSATFGDPIPIEINGIHIIPEPSSLSLLVLGASALLWHRRKAKA